MWGTEHPQPRIPEELGNLLPKTIRDWDGKGFLPPFHLCHKEKLRSLRVRIGAVINEGPSLFPR